MLILVLTAVASFVLGFYLRSWVFTHILRRRDAKAFETETMARLIIESVKDYAIFRLDQKGYIKTWNKGAQALKGYEPHEIIGSHFSRFYREEDKATGFCEYELREADAKGRFEGEGWRIRKDGSEFWANVIISAIRDGDGKLLGFSKVTRDLTERRRAEEELKRHASQLKEAQKIARVGSWEWDVRENKITWSDELFEIYGVDKTKFDPSYEGYLARLNPSQRVFIEKIIADAMESGKDFTFEHTMRQDDGSIKHVHARGRVFKDKDGQVVKMTGTAQDITDRKRIEDELVQNQAELEQKVLARTAELHEAMEGEKQAKVAAMAATDAKMQFLANMSHEIRTPMNAILGFSDLLNTDELSPQQCDYLSRIQSNGDQLLQIIDDILDLSKFEAGKVPLNQTDFSFFELLDEVTKSLSSLAKKKGLTIEVVKSSNTPWAIHSDSMRLRQILINLLSNAIKFTAKGRIRVLTDLTKNEEGLPVLLIEVEDTGIGIPDEHQLKLFQPFVQADGSIARKFGGTGLGLTLSRHIAHALHGELVLKSSAPGVGSSFLLSLTLEKNPQMTVTSSPTAPSPEKMALAQLKLARQAHVLLADDSMENDMLVRHYLKHDTIQIDSARNGLEALRLANQKNYDLILMDLQMPELDGLEATRRLREKGFKNPIIAWTAHAFREDKERSLQAGCSGYLSKPVNRQELVNLVVTSLEATV